jgi:hypothetical protein
MSGENAEEMADDLTAARFQKSVSRKRLRKTGTITVGEKVRRKLDGRAEAVGRNVIRHELADHEAALAVKTLIRLQGEQLADAVRRANLLCSSHNQDELERVRRSRRALDRALYFVYNVATAGSAFHKEAFRRNPEVARRFDAWVAKTNRMLQREERARARKLDEKRALKKKLKIMRKSHEELFHSR